MIHIFRGKSIHATLTTTTNITFIERKFADKRNTLTFEEIE